MNPVEALPIASSVPVMGVAETVPIISPKVRDFELVTDATKKRDLSYVGYFKGVKAGKFKVKFLSARDAENSCLFSYYVRHRRHLYPDHGETCQSLTMASMCSKTLLLCMNKNTECKI